MTTKQIPRDAQVIQAIMKDMGITEYEPRVVNQLLEFVYSKKPFKYCLCFLNTEFLFLSQDT